MSKGDVIQEGVKSAMARLAHQLDQIDSRRNIAPIDEFIKTYGILYSTKGVQEEDHNYLRMLEAKFRATYDMYRPIQLVDLEGNVILELPPVFNEVKLSDSKYNINSVITSIKPGMFPKHMAETVSLIGKIFIKSQLEEGESYEAYRRRIVNSCKEQVDKFKEISSDTTTQKTTPTKEDQSTRSMVDTNDPMDVFMDYFK